MPAVKLSMGRFGRSRSRRGRSRLSSLSLPICYRSRMAVFVSTEDVGYGSTGSLISGGCPAGWVLGQYELRSRIGDAQLRVATDDEEEGSGRGIVDSIRSVGACSRRRRPREGGYGLARAFQRSFVSLGSLALGAGERLARRKSWLPRDDSGHPCRSSSLQIRPLHSIAPACVCSLRPRGAHSA